MDGKVRKTLVAILVVGIAAVNFKPFRTSFIQEALPDRREFEG